VQGVACQPRDLQPCLCSSKQLQSQFGLKCECVGVMAIVSGLPSVL
jgi:hypothetical protein